MIAVIFEVWPKPERKNNYLDIAAQLRPILEKIDGFISIERFESLTEPGKILSLSFFRDETAVQAWRATSEHRLASIGHSFETRDCNVAAHKQACITNGPHISHRTNSPAIFSRKTGIMTLAPEIFGPMLVRNVKFGT
jgi:heme-degrading monooxygenase HmoA